MESPHLIEGDAHTLSCLNNGMTGLAYGVSLRVAHPFLVQKGDGDEGWQPGLMACMAETLSLIEHKSQFYHGHGSFFPCHHFL